MPPVKRPAGPLLEVLLDVLQGVAHGVDLLRVLIRDLEVEFLLERHDQLDKVERIGIQVFNERRLRRYVGLVNPQLLDDDLLHSVIHIGRHQFTSSGLVRCFSLDPRMAPSTPLTNLGEVALPNRRASSTASLIATLAGAAELSNINS